MEVEEEESGSQSHQQQVQQTQQTQKVQQPRIPIQLNATKQQKPPQTIPEQPEKHQPQHTQQQSQLHLIPKPVFHIQIDDRPTPNPS